jgi:hypothetical protein
MQTDPYLHKFKLTFLTGFDDAVRDAINPYEYSL